MEVNKKAEELENEMKIEENMRLSKKKAEQDAKVKAEKEKIRLAEEKRKKLEEEQKQKALGDGPNKKTVDFAELYKGLDTEMVQLGSEYQRHSKFMQHELDLADKEQEKKDQDEAENELYGLYKTKAEREADKAEIQKTIDHAELYDQIALQTGEQRPYEKHHEDWDAQVEEESAKLEKQMAEVEHEQQFEQHHKTVDMNDLYENMAV